MRHTRPIVTGAVCAAALCIGGLMGPPGAAVALLVAPLPALVVGGAAGAVHALVSSLAAGSLMSGVLGWPVGAAFLALAGIPAALGVTMLRRAWRLEPALGAMAGATALGALALLVSVIPDVTTWPAALAEAWRTSFDGALDMYREIGIPADQLAELDAARDEMGRTVLRLLPALVVVTTAALWLVNLRLSSRWIGWPQLSGLACWRVPDALIWLLIGAGFAMFAPLPALAATATNLFAVALACYFCQGLAIVSYFLQRYGLPRGLRFATYVVIAFQHIAAALVVALGVFDLWGDFRHLTARHADAAIGSDSD